VRLVRRGRRREAVRRMRRGALLRQTLSGAALEQRGGPAQGALPRSPTPPRARHRLKPVSGGGARESRHPPAEKNTFEYRPPQLQIPRPPPRRSRRGCRQRHLRRLPGGRWLQPPPEPRASDNGTCEMNDGMIGTRRVRAFMTLLSLVRAAARFPTWCTGAILKLKSKFKSCSS